MILTFWGVRGSTPVPGPDTMKTGGNTVCIDVATEDDSHHAVMDSGTGVIRLGKSLLGGPSGKGQGRIDIFLTHTHWDHIQGFPFFVPAFIPGNSIAFWGRANGGRSLEALLEGQMRVEFSPIFQLGNMGASIEVKEMGAEPVEFGPFVMSTIVVPHLGSDSLGCRISDSTSSAALLGDVHYPEGASEEIVSFVRGADVLVHDVGESEHIVQGAHVAVDLAQKAGIPRLLLTHFAPWHTDDDAERLVDAARSAAGSSVEVNGAREGMQVNL